MIEKDDSCLPKLIDPFLHTDTMDACEHLEHVIRSNITLSVIQHTTKVFNSKEVGEVQEGADCYCDKKLSKHC